MAVVACADENSTMDCPNYVAAACDDVEFQNWDTSLVSDFTSIFAFMHEFNANISGWDVSAGTDFSNMFYNALPSISRSALGT